MGRITTGVGLISGIDTATLIEQLLAIEARGKIPLQTRIARLQSQQASLLDINARLLSLKSAAAGFRGNLVFDQALATSSDESVLTATASAAQPGVFNFTVKQLVSNSQKLSKGFADSTTAPAGMGSISFEFGNGKLAGDTDLSALNGGTGVRRGKIEINGTTVNLSTTTTVGEVIRAINESGANVTASVDGDRLVVVENDGAALEIADAVGDFTATDLGIADSEPGGTITGLQINRLGDETALRQLNDSTGVFITDGTDDIQITNRNGVSFGVDFGRVNNPITASTLIEDLNNGSGVTLNSDEEADILFVDRTGDSHEVDLTGIETVQDLMDRVDGQTGGNITITITGGNKIVVNDNTGAPSGLLKIQGFGVNDEETAVDLGILNVAGVDAPTHTGSLIVNADHLPQARTIEEVIDRINDDAENLGTITADIAPDGVSLRITDNTGQTTSNLIVDSTITNPYAARDLGIEADVAAATIDGNRLMAAMNSTLVRSLNGGTGLAGATTLRIIDKLGGTDVFTLDEDGSLQDVIDLVNASALVDVTASLNETGTGLFIQDNTGGGAALRVYDTGAAALGIDTGLVGTPDSFVRGTNVQKRYVAEGSRLEDLNYGRGIGTGSFRITDGQGNQVTISIGDDSVLLYDVIEEINSLAAAQNVDVTARVNDNGDGIQLDNDLGTGLIRVESISGSVAAGLGITGTAATDGGSIDGSYEKSVDLHASDTLTEVINAINEANLPVAVSVVNSGAGAKPFHLSFASQITGKPGELIIEGLDGAGGFYDLELATIAEARNAKVFFGAADPADAVLIERSANQLSDVLEGVTIDLVSASDDPVTLSVTRDEETMTQSVTDFVSAFNDAIDRIDTYDFFDVESETRGPLLGNPTTARVRSALFRVLQGPATGLTGRYTRLSQVGITIGSDNNVRFDGDKFREAYELDPDAVKDLFSAFESSTATSEEIADGITVSAEEETVSSAGFGELFNRLLDDLTNSLTGVVTNATSTIQDQIDLTNERIDTFDGRLEARRDQLEREFTAMETILARLQVQSNSLVSLIGNLSVAQGLAQR